MANIIARGAAMQNPIAKDFAQSTKNAKLVGRSFVRVTKNEVIKPIKDPLIIRDLRPLILRNTFDKNRIMIIEMGKDFNNKTFNKSLK